MRRTVSRFQGHRRNPLACNAHRPAAFSMPSAPYKMRAWMSAPCRWQSARLWHTTRRGRIGGKAPHRVRLPPIIHADRRTPRRLAEEQRQHQALGACAAPAL